MARRRTTARADPAELEPEGTLICEGEVPGRPVGWKAPRIGKNGGTIPTRDYDAYRAWQKTIKLHARVAMGRRRPYRGPVCIRFDFSLAPRGGTPPDVTNLQKSAEDALQEIVFANDTLVCDVRSTRAITDAEPQGVRFRVVAAGR